MAGFFLFLFCGICCFIAAKAFFNDYDSRTFGRTPQELEKDRKTTGIFFILFGIANIMTAIMFLGK